MTNTSRFFSSDEVITDGTAVFVRSVLEICSAEESDGDEYNCVATSIAGSDNTTFHVLVETTEGKY